MGKKRKAGGKPLGQPGAREIDEADAKLRINTYEDVADSEDEFHINRDKILLGEDSQQRKRRRLQEEGERSKSHVCLANANFPLLQRNS